MGNGMGNKSWFVYTENGRPVEVYTDKEQALVRLTINYRLTPRETESITKFRATSTEPGARLLIVGWEGKPDRGLCHVFGPKD